MSSDRQERKAMCIQWIMILLFGGAAFSLCFNNNIWTDEAFTMQLLQQDVMGIVKGTAADVHPPLYYLIAKGFQFLFGPSMFVQKVASIIPAVLTLLLGATKIKKLFGYRVSGIFILLLAILPCTFVHAIQPRMYTWGLLFVTICGVYAYDVYLDASWKKWCMMLLFGTASAYTHYFALLSVAYIYLILLFALFLKKRKQIKNWFIMAIITTILYLPWLWVWLKQLLTVAQDYCIPNITMQTIWSYAQFVFQTSTPYSTVLFLILFVIAMSGLLAAILKKREEEDCFAFACLLVPIATTVAGVVLSFLIRPIYSDRYVYPAMGLLALSFAIAVKYWRFPVVMSLCLFLGATGIAQYKDTYQQEYCDTKVVETEQFFKEHLGERDIILYNFTGYGFIYEHYWSKDILAYIEDFDFGREYDTIWFLDSHNYPNLPEDALTKYHLKQEFMGMYGIEHNEFEIYKITRQ
ncbi:MAG: glycosyltransferase family 39 protein [Lachnospiraceae bacterium]